jgi:cobalt-zinc-cadmium efflux system protein
MPHTNHSNSSKNIKVAFFLNLGFAVFELIGGFLVNSVAILSDALHDLGDSLSLGLSWVLDRKSKQPGDKKYTFGYQRYSLLGALINSIVLVAGSVFIVVEAIDRLISPQHSNAMGMLLFAFVGIAVNGFAAFRLKEGKTLNEKVAFWHLLEDVLGWIAVLFASLAMMVTKSPYIDPALSILITLFILWQVVKRLKETAFIFLQGVPPQLSISAIEHKILEIEGVKSLHHTHLWSLDGEQNVFTTHVKLNSSIKTAGELTALREKLNQVLKEFAFSHHTIELELDSEVCRFEQ